MKYWLDRHFAAALVILKAPTPQNGQTHKTIRWLFPTNCLSVFEHFVGLALKGIRPTVACLPAVLRLLRINSLSSQHICYCTTRFQGFRSSLYNVRLLLGSAKISSNFSFLSKRYKAITACRCKQPLQKVLKRIYTVYTYSNRTIYQLLCY